MKYKTEREWQKDLLLKDGDYTSYKDIVIRTNNLIPDRVLLADLDEKKNIVNHTAHEIYETVSNFANGLLSLKEKGNHIAILANNQYRYIIADIAISTGVGVVTPIDKDAPAELLVTLLNKAEINTVLIQDYLIEDIEKIKSRVPSLKNIYIINKKVDGYKSFDEICELGKKNSGKWEKEELDVDGLSMILFTSGTTGANKAVMLTQRNLAANAMNCLDVIRGTNEENTSMSVLPFHHATEINTHVMARIAAGRLTYINESMKEMMINMKIFKPTCVTIVPMIANMFYKTIWQNAKKAGMDKKLKMGIKVCKLVKNLTGKDITHKLFGDVFANFGGNLREIVVGGAMLSPEVVKGLADLGMFMCNGYGITECGPLISLNTKTIKDPYSVGIIAPTLEYKVENIDEDGYGELCVKGPSVAKGYYKDDKATKEAFDSNGFFHTGDMVRVDKHKVINMSGRKKNVIVLSNGKNICPEEIENEVFNHIPYLNDVVVYKINNKAGNEILVCGVYIEDEEARKNKEQIKEDFRKVNELLSSYKRINYVNIVDSEYQKTSTRKIIRTKLLDRHNDETGVKI